MTSESNPSTELTARTHPRQPVLVARVVPRGLNRGVNGRPGYCLVEDSTCAASGYPCRDVPKPVLCLKPG